ncbi:MAG: hypothetical protein KJO85_03455, partial [Gammaproteobacteria bacterium]|nr:hypothetical protein [Gammaproteobacteria bacterium]
HRLLESDLPLARAAALSGPYNSTEPTHGFEPVFTDLLNDQHLDAPALWKLAYVCQRPAHRNACEQHEVYERLARSDPGNAAVYLWPRAWQSVDDRELAVLSDKQILRASRAERFDSYFGRDAHLLYDLSLELVTRHPHPDTFTAGGLAWQAYWLVTGMIISDMQRLAPLFRHCEEGVREVNDTLETACFRIAGLMKDHGNTVLGTMFGRALERRLLMQKDPESPVSLALYRKQRLESKAWQCLYQTLWPNPLEDPGMAASEFRERLRLLSDLGEREWYERLADMDYETNPQDWERSPQECRALRDLEGEALIAELGELDPYDTWLKESEQIKAERAEAQTDS